MTQSYWDNRPYDGYDSEDAEIRTDDGIIIRTVTNITRSARRDCYGQWHFTGRIQYDEDTEISVWTNSEYACSPDSWSTYSEE